MISAKALTELEAAVAVLNEHRYQDCGHWNIQGDGKVVVRSAVPRAISIAAVDAIAIAEGLNAKEQVVTLSRALQTAREACAPFLAVAESLPADAVITNVAQQSGKHSEVVTIIKAEQWRNLLAALQPEPASGPQTFVDGWTHGCAAVCANIELWVARCPNCGMPHIQPEPASGDGWLPGTFAWALEQMKAGKRVARGDSSMALRLSRESDFIREDYERPEGTSRYAPLSVSDFERTDWRVVDEPPASEPQPEI